jgi:hypothetical protein
MSDMLQPIFNRSYSEELREDLASGGTLTDYLLPDIEVPESGILQSTLEVSDTVPELATDVGSDTENAIKVYEFLKNLDKTQASDKRLWIYLSHVTFRNYTMGRWGLKTSAEELTESPDAKRKAISYVSERWFLSGNARSLRRHSIARLWWAAYLTVAPWSKDPEYFGSLENEDRYIYTKILFITQDIVQQILERRLGWSDRLLIAILEFLRQHPEIAQNRDAVRSLMKELNLVLGYRKLSVLSFDELLAVIADTATDINAS